MSVGFPSKCVQSPHFFSNFHFVASAYAFFSLCFFSSFVLVSLWPFIFLFFPCLFRCSVLMVPGYNQVSGKRKDLFCCFGSPISLAAPRGRGVGKGYQYWSYHSLVARLDSADQLAVGLAL